MALLKHTLAGGAEVASACVPVHQPEPIGCGPNECRCLYRGGQAQLHRPSARIHRSSISQAVTAELPCSWVPGVARCDDFKHGRSVLSSIKVHNRFVDRKRLHQDKSRVKTSNPEEAYRCIPGKQLALEVGFQPLHGFPLPCIIGLAIAHCNTRTGMPRQVHDPIQIDALPEQTGNVGSTGTMKDSTLDFKP
jgi:hypothetical protein